MADVIQFIRRYWPRFAIAFVGTIAVAVLHGVLAVHLHSLDSDLIRFGGPFVLATALYCLLYYMTAFSMVESRFIRIYGALILGGCSGLGSAVYALGCLVNRFGS